MRARSSAILSKEQLKCYQTPIKSSALTRKFVPIDIETPEYDDDEFNSFFEQIDPFLESSKAKSNIKGDNSDGKSQVLTPTSYCSSGINFRDSLWSNFSSESDGKSIQIFKSMIIGAKGVGKHTLVHSMFEDSHENTYAPKHGFDFVCKGLPDEKKKFKFWIKDSCSESKGFEELYNFYYKTVSTFIFIYDAGDKSSLQSLEKSIKSVQEVIPKENFFGILVANSKTSSQDPVDIKEAVNFKEKYGFAYFVETNLSEESCDEVLDMIEDSTFYQF